MQRRFNKLFFFAGITILFAGYFLFFGLPEFSDPPPPNFSSPDGSHPEAPAPPPDGLDRKPPEGGSSSGAPPPSPSPPSPPPEEPTASPAAAPPRTGPVHVTITETGGSHDEVVAALVHSFGSQADAELDLYQLLPRFGIKGIMRNFTLPRAAPEPKSPDRFMAEGANTVKPDIFVAGTCELDIVRFKDQLDALLAARKTYLFCVVHHADRWASPEHKHLEPAIKAWVDAGLVEFWTLSPHTAMFLETESLSKWNKTPGAPDPRIRYFVPVFPVTLPAQDTQEAEAEAEAEEAELGFGLQGDYDPARRDYGSIFGQLGEFLAAAPSQLPLTMHLLGHGTHPSVPDNVAAHVAFDENLDYIDYYAILARTFALLPAFATDQYLDRKASSSVPAALIAGTPLVATQKIVDAYSYVGADAVWLQADRETDLDVVGRVLKMQPRQRREKKRVVQQRCAEIVARNSELVGKWVGLALEKLDAVPENSAQRR